MTRRSSAGFMTCTILVFALGSSGARSAPPPFRSLLHSVNPTVPNAAFANPLTSPLSGEVLTATKYELAVVSCRLHGGKTTFTASGTATGPFPGTFTATGTWHHHGTPYKISLHFRESFTIKSGMREISGHIELLNNANYGAGCEEIQNPDLHYKTDDHWTGVASAGISNSGFSEAFDS